MVSLFEGLTAPLQGLFKLLNSPFMIIFALTLGIIAIAGLIWYNSVKPRKEILYVSEAEHQGEKLLISRDTPKHLHTKRKKDPYEFIRFREPYNFTFGMKSLTWFFGKVGTAYTQSLESGDVGPFTLWDIMNSVWGTDTCEALIDEQKQKLIESKVPITVKLEEGYTPEGYKAENELAIQKEADAEAAKIFGLNLRSQMSKEDWIRTAALVGCGVAIAYVGQAMGILAGIG